MNIMQSSPDFPPANCRGACANCSLRAGCLPAGLNAGQLAQFEGLLSQPLRIRRNAYLHRAGSPLQWLSVVRSGSLKVSVMDKDGREQIMGFCLTGELLGMDAIDTGRHVCDVVALEASEVCKIPFAELQRLSRDVPSLGHNLHRMISAEIGRGYGVMLLLGSMRAEERLATFLLNLSHRFLARGYSPSQLRLRMARHEIASYLGLKLETVSRMFSRFQREGMVAVHGKEIRLLNLEKLQAITQGADSLPAALPAHADAAAVMNRFPSVAPRGHAATG